MKLARAYILASVVAFVMGPGTAQALPRARLAPVANEDVAKARGGGFRMSPDNGYRARSYGGWRRPYAWPPGGAIAAGAAIGVMSAEAAVGYATLASPAAGLCWFYTDDSGTEGFWDICQ